MKDDSGAQFLLHRARLSPMTAAKMMDVNARPGCDGQAADAVQVKLEDSQIAQISQVRISIFCLELLFVHRKQGLFLSVSVDDDMRMAGKKQNMAPMWKN